MKLKQIIGIRIKELRTKSNYTQSELAEKVGIATKHQSCIETGRNFPSAELFEKYASAFNIDVSEIFSLKPSLLDKTRKETIDGIIKNVNVASDYELGIIEKVVSSIIEK